MIKNIGKIVDFFNDDTLYYSASLSFFTIFSLLPILALVIAVMSTYPIFSQNIDLLMLYVLDFVNPTHSLQVTSTIEQFLANIDQLGNLGLIYLLFVFTMFFKDYEHIVSKIYHTKRRTFISLVFLYLSFLLFIPIALVVFTFILSLIDLVSFQMILKFGFGLFVMTLLFKTSVNTHISLKSSIISAFLTLGSLKVTQSLFIYYVLYNTTYSTIYGTLSALLFFFLWIYISWTIYLYGTKLCYKLNLEYQQNEN